MKTIEKITQDGDIQIFEIITSRNELRKIISEVFWDGLYSEYKTGIFEDPDTTVAYYDKDNQFHFYSEGEPTTKKINVAKIERLKIDNGSTTVIYGNVPIVQNGQYGDWEAELD